MSDREQLEKLGEKGVEVLMDTTLKEQPKPTKLSEIDKLKLHNAFLRYHSVMTQRANIKSQMEILRRDAATSDEALAKAKVALVEQREHISKEYGVDLQKVSVNEEGEFVPLDLANTPFPVQGPTNGGN